ncbi:hypothetical protein HK104_001507 [Borealophlyctis nickersoniae]|nr:hypothetical protein HK104_001507 [Borealophlyctis nickersoniae]
MSLPYELFPPIVRRAHPTVGRNLRSLNKRLSKIITLDDLVWGEAGWRWHQSTANCWVWAARNGHAGIVGLLQEADPEAKESFGWAALAVAAARGHTDLVRMFVDTDPEGYEDVGELLGFALGKKRSRSVEDDDGDNNSTDEDDIPEGASPGAVADMMDNLSFLIGTLDVPIASHVVDSLAFIIGNLDELFWIQDTHLLDVKDFSLWLAAHQGHEEVVQFLIQAGADVDTGEGRPLLTAAARGHVEVVQLLLNAGADVHAVDAATLDVIKAKM